MRRHLATLSGLVMIATLAVALAVCATATAQTPPPAPASSGSSGAWMTPAPPPAQPAPAAPNASSEHARRLCMPPCRVGFMCVQGRCVDECNPSCPAGQECRNGLCLGSSEQAAAAEPDQAAIAAAADRAWQERLANRLRWHLVFGGGFSMISDRIDRTAVNDGEMVGFEFIQLGARINVHPMAGLQVRGALGYHTASRTPSSSSYGAYYDSQTLNTHATSVGASVLPFLGPFGRFYFGPELWGGYYWLAKKTDTTTVYGSQGNQTVTIDFTDFGGWRYGMVGIMGIVIGRTEAIDIWGGVRVDNFGWIMAVSGIAANLPL